MPSLQPGDPAPATGAYEELNIFGSRTGRVHVTQEGEALPPAPRSFTWRPVAPASTSGNAKLDYANRTAEIGVRHPLRASRSGRALEAKAVTNAEAEKEKEHDAEDDQTIANVALLSMQAVSIRASMESPWFCGLD
jgi:hypothetical protein